MERTTKERQNRPPKRTTISRDFKAEGRARTGQIDVLMSGRFHVIMLKLQCVRYLTRISDPSKFKGPFSDTAARHFDSVYWYRQSFFKCFQ